MINPLSSSLNSATLPRTERSRDAQATQQIVSGKPMNRAADDPARSEVIEQFATQISGRRQAARNLNEGISQVQTAERALSGIQENTQRIRELAVQAGNPGLNAQDRAALQEEANNLSASNRETLEQTSYNGQPLFNRQNLSLQAGSSAANTLQINNNAPQPQQSIDFSSAEAARNSLTVLDQDLKQISSSQASLGAARALLEARVDQFGQQSSKLQVAQSQQGDTDYAASASTAAQAGLRQQSELAVQVQANANSRQVISLLRT